MKKIFLGVALAVGFATGCATANIVSTNVSFTTTDGVILRATKYYSDNNVGKKMPAVILLHQWGSSRKAYESFGRLLASEGFYALAIDGRGYGESFKKTDGTKITAQLNIQEDIAAAEKYLSEQADVNPKKISIVGASYGASNAIKFASDHPEIVVTVLLSPGMNYFDSLPITDPIAKMKDRRLMNVASTGDTTSLQCVNEIADQMGKLGGSPVNVVYQGSAHGTAMFAERKELAREILSYIQIFK